ncbi:shikimate dehydrogenase family protein [Falsiroseomonas sp. HW251]|uniref:shikimate dehydrogenase family protein n=1 Tax=Falsiroseomonas sp. HW251 TaxID=3390998 RepID=UPI003D315F50
MDITGATRLFAIVGDPVAPLRSPALFNAAFARLRRDAVFVAIQVAAEDLAQAWPGLAAIRNLDGLVITMPHKEGVARLLPALGPTARLTGSVNTVRRRADGGLEGEMFDGEGFRDGVERAGHAIAGRRVLQVGCGAAGTAIACALARAGAAELALNDVTAARAEALAALLRSNFPGTRAVPAPPYPRGFDIVVNATPLGLRAGDPLPLDASGLAAGQLVADVIPNPEVTPLIAAARALGCATTTGREMHEGQARLAAAWLGIEGF